MEDEEAYTLTEKGVLSIAWARHMFNEGMSYDEIASHLDIERETLQVLFVLGEDAGLMDFLDEVDSPFKDTDE